MSGKFLSPEATLRAFELVNQPYRPPQIVNLKEEIESDKRVLELKYSVTGQVDQEGMNKTLAKMLELDRLYALWAEDKLDEA